MNVVEQLDDLAGQGALACVSLTRIDDAWQAALQSARTGGHVVMRKATPSEALAAVLAFNPIAENYDTAHRLARPLKLGELPPQAPSYTSDNSKSAPGIFD